MAGPKVDSDLHKKVFQIYQNLRTAKISPTQAITTLETLEKQNNWKNKDLGLNIKLFKALGFHLSNQTEKSALECISGLQKIKESGYKNDTLHFKLLSDLGYYYNARFDFENALTYFDKGAVLLSKNPKIKSSLKEYTIAYFTNYSRLQREKGDPHKSILLLNEALTLTNTKETEYYKLFIFKALATNYFLIGEIEKAKLYYQQALKIAKKGEEKCEIELSLAQIYLKQNKAEEAKTQIINARKNLFKSAFKEAGAQFPALEMAIEAKWAKHYFIKNNKAECTTHCRNVIQISNAKFGNEKGPHVADAYLMLAKISAIKNAEIFFEKSIKSCFAGEKIEIQNLISVEKYIEVLWEKAEYYFQTKHPKKDEAILSAVKAVNQIKSSLEEDDSKLYFLKAKSDFYEKAIVMISPENIAGIFKIMEYSKAALISDVLKKNQFKASTIAKDLIKKELLIKREINKYRLKLNNANSLAEKKTNEIKIREAQIALTNIQTEIRIKSPNYQKQVNTLDSVEISAIKNVLKPDQAILSFYYSENKIGIMCIGKNYAKFRMVTNTPIIESKLKKLLKEINTNPGISEFDDKNIAKDLYRVFFNGFENELKNLKQLVVIRDGLLQYLPFEVLVDQNGRFLIEKYEFQYGWSANIWKIEKNDDSPSPRSGLMAIAPFTSENASGKVADELKPLLASKKEVEQIGGDIFLEKKAKKDLFFKNYQNYDIIHFATHAQLNDTDPNLSFIAFYPDEKESKLFTQELFDLNFDKTQLVVLSACEGGYGYNQKGEGLMSLARAFAYAGCPSVITTLWKANDETSAFIAANIHKYLKKGYNKAKAVQQAKLDLLHNEEFGQYDHPYFWSNFILIGNDKPIDINLFENFKKEIYWILAFLFAIALRWYYISRKSKK